MAVTSLRWLAALSATLPAVYGNSLPAPTSDPREDIGVLHQRAPVPTGAPVVRALQKRAGDICGYRTGDFSDPYQCADDDSVCLVNSAASAIGCCASTSCNIWTACMPYTSSRATATANLDRTRYCSDPAKPHCATLVYVDEGTYSGWTINSCAAAPTVIAMIDVPSGSATRTTGRIAFTSLEPIDTRTRTTADGTSLEPVDTSTRTGTADSAGQTGGAGDGDDDDNLTPQPAKSGPPIGAIVGGVVGGVVALALLGLLIFFLVRNSKKKALQPAGPAPGVGGAPPPQPMYAPVPQQQQMSQAPPPQGGFYEGKPPMASATPVPYGHPEPTGSPPPPMYNQTPMYNNQTPPAGAGYPSPPQPVSPQFTGQQSSIPSQFTGQTQQSSPYQPYGQPVPQQQAPPQNYAELPTQRGDGQLHEVA
ncbi:hypothetical protein QBC35DRAFT_524561 [Podospora australis]|uniref:Mid2 domain-containing protein n=1 Tax=Podospora australis TaxID=1536484 RepID=A0AAN6WQS9_9PEZI|nr:hypothetical protein QBC35DRAFT_524561 [Podospora australis]